MNSNAYELLALCMRYIFAALMVLIVVRAARITLVDGRRAAKLRRLSPETGIIGEFLVVDGSDRAKTGMHYPVILEGTIGSGRRCDIRLRAGSVHYRHAIFQMTADGLYIRSHGRLHLRDGFGRPVRNLILNDGDYIMIGSVRLMLVLSGTDARTEELPSQSIQMRSQSTPTVEPGISRDSSDPFDLSDDRGIRPAKKISPKRKPVRQRHSSISDPARYNTDSGPSESNREQRFTDSNLFSDHFESEDFPYVDTDDNTFYDYDEYDDC